MKTTIFCLLLLSSLQTQAAKNVKDKITPETTAPANSAATKVNPVWAGLKLKNLPDQSTVSFLAVGKPSMIKIRGEAKGPTAQLKADKGQLTGSTQFSLEQLDTGIALRNEHMKEKYLQVKQYPNAILTLTEAPIDSDFEKTLSNASEKTFHGKLQLHGKEQNVTGTFTTKEGKTEAKFNLNISDFGIELPSYLGVKVAEKVDVSVNLSLVKE